MRGIVALAAGLLGLAGCVDAAPTSTITPLPQGEPMLLTSDQVATVKAGFNGALKDPYTAEFSRFAAVEYPNGPVVVCGLVKGKDDLGAYGSEVPFTGILHPGSFKIIAVGITPKEAGEVNQVCSEVSQARSSDRTDRPATATPQRGRKETAA